MSSDAVTDDAQRRARELQEEAELEARRILVDAGRERIRQMDELARERAALQEAWTTSLPAAVRKAEREAEELLSAAEITDAARRRADELIEEAEREARAIVVGTGDERARLLTALENERRELEYAKVRIGSITALEEAAQESLLAAELKRVTVLHES